MSGPKRVCQVVKVCFCVGFSSEYNPLFSCTVIIDCYCMHHQLKPEALSEYKSVHAAVWPGVLAAIERAHIVDYSIHYLPELNLLIANFKYVGNDYEKDMASVANDVDTQRWWKLTDGMQESLVDGATGSGGEIPWWKAGPSLFDTDIYLTMFCPPGTRRSIPIRGRAEVTQQLYVPSTRLLLSVALRN